MATTVVIRAANLEEQKLLPVVRSMTKPCICGRRSNLQEKNGLKIKIDRERWLYCFKSSLDQQLKEVNPTFTNRRFDNSKTLGGAKAASFPCPDTETAREARHFKTTWQEIVDAFDFGLARM